MEKTIQERGRPTSIGFRSKAGPEWMTEVAPTVLETIYKDGGLVAFLMGTKEKKEGPCRMPVER